jgi:hypothetical protein
VRQASPARAAPRVASPKRTSATKEPPPTQQPAGTPIKDPKFWDAALKHFIWTGEDKDRIRVSVFKAALRAENVHTDNAYFSAQLRAWGLEKKRIGSNEREVAGFKDKL